MIRPCENLRRTYSFYLLNKRPGPLFACPWGAVVRLESFAWSALSHNSYFTPKAERTCNMQQAAPHTSPCI